MAGFNLVKHLGDLLLLSKLSVVVCRRDGSHAVMLGAQDGIGIADLLKVGSHFELTLRILNSLASPAVLKLRPLVGLADGALRARVLNC